MERCQITGDRWRNGMDWKREMICRMRHMRRILQRIWQETGCTLSNTYRLLCLLYRVRDGLLKGDRTKIWLQ